MGLLIDMPPTKPHTPYNAYVENFDVTRSGGSFVSLTLNNPAIIVNELFGALEYLSEVEVVGKEFLKRNRAYPYPVTEHYKLFQSFIRQAITFYKSAETLDYRSSPLIYYYSFLNLVKAYCCIKDPKKFNKRMGHGLSHKLSTKKFTEQKVSVQDGVFKIFYEQLMGTPIKNKLNLKISDLISYCNDVGYEYQISGYGRRSVFFGKTALAVNQTNNQMWVVVAISGFNLFKKYPRKLSKFMSNFEEVSFPQSNAIELLGIKASEYKHYIYFESKNKYPVGFPKFPASNLVFDSLRDFFNDTVYSNNYNLTLALPIRNNPVTPFNETLAIYAGMYYMSSLVRYQPQYLEKILTSKESWLLQRFIKSSTQTFLRQMVNLIRNENCIFRTL